MSLLPPALSAEHDTIWPGISPGPLGVSCSGCAPFQILEHSQPSPHWWGEEQKRPWLYCWAVLTQLNHPWIINTASSTNPKQPIPMSAKTINSTLWKTVHWVVFCGALQTDQLGGIGLYYGAIFTLFIQEVYAELLGATLCYCAFWVWKTDLIFFF